MKAILVGFMGSGKTTVGNILADELGVAYHDLDDIIVQEAGKTIPEIFAQGGEESFRQIETQALESAIGLDGILGTGGGTPMRSENQKLLSETDAPVILLDVLPETIMSRLSGDNNRPLVQQLGPVGLRDLKQKRDSTYYGVSDFTISTDKLTPEEVAKRALEGLAKISGGMENSND